jgi:hypothetical protein
LATIYNAAWADNWGNVPLTDAELNNLYASLKQYFHPSLGVFGLVNGQNVGFMFGMPDMNQVLHKAYPRPGEPEIITLLKALWHWKIRPKITRQRVLLFGVNPEYRSMGVDAAIYLKYLQNSMALYPNIDAGWILETNLGALNQAAMFGAKEYRRYRFYEKAL